MPFIKNKRNKIISYKVHLDEENKIKTPDNYKKLKFVNSDITISVKYMGNHDYNLLDFNQSI